MRDADETVIYVGKAKSLRARVRSYFASDVTIKTRTLMGRVARIDYLVTGNEYEALLLENNLIKEHQPRYNINLKDGKSYPVIRVTADEYPRVFKTRNIVHDGSTYYGPFTQVGVIDTYLEVIGRAIPLRRCRTPQIKPRKTPCLYYHIGRCAAVCAGKTSHSEYMERIARVNSLLDGDTDAFRSDLRGRMEAASAELAFERAAELRDAIRSVDEIEAEQRIVDFDPEIRDYIGYATRDALCTFVVFQMRSGRMVGSRSFHAELPGDDDENLAAFIVQFYSTTRAIPSRLYSSSEIGNLEELKRFFTEELGATVRLMNPETSRDAAVLRLATENARQELDKRLRETGDLPALEALATALGLAAPPLRIEGFDIAHIGGKHTVAAMVSFANGVPQPAAYRRFRVRTLPDGSIDDYAAMREVVARRYTRVKNERLERPNLVLIDGGPGQVSAAVAVLAALELPIPVVGLSKRLEELHLPDRPASIRLPEGTPALRIVQHVRDEAHRFATSYRARLQKRDIMVSTLESIEGIGPVRAGRLLKAFPTIESIIDAPVDIIARSASIPQELADRVRAAIRTSVYGSEG